MELSSLQAKSIIPKGVPAQKGPSGAHQPHRETKSRTTKASDDDDDADIDMDSGVDDYTGSDPGYSSAESGVTDSDDPGYSSDESGIADSDDEAFSSEAEEGESVDTDDERDSAPPDSGYNTDVDRSAVADRDFIDDVTDDEYDAGPEVTAAMVWRHITFHIIRNPTPGQPNILLAKITLLHTKGGDKNPRVKTFVFVHHPDPMFDLLGQLLSMAIDNGIFTSDMSIEDIYRYRIPSCLPGMDLKVKRGSLDQPVFRQPVKGPDGYRTSKTP
ncbi:hypothetical protein FQN49_005240, partial [Arthroderma sp. PD_2]